MGMVVEYDEEEESCNLVGCHCDATSPKETTLPSIPFGAWRLMALLILLMVARLLKAQ
jgi:hypothetical protein